MYNTTLVVKKTLKIKLNTDINQHYALLGTMNVFNQICNEFSNEAFNNKEFRKNQLQKIVYHSSREKYKEFSSQLTIRAIDCVSCSYKIKKHPKYPNSFKKNSAVVYDDRVITFKKDNIVNIWTVNGRINIPIIIYNKELFNYRKGQVDLVYKNNKWFLLCTIDVPEAERYTPKECIGVDLGIKSIATTSDNESYSGSIIEEKRKQFHNHRSRLQKRNTRSSKRRIKTIGRKESKGVNKRAAVRKSSRNERMSWSFYQLRSFIEYKALEAGVTVVMVPAPYTSQTCSECGHCEKGNRKSQSSFNCKNCGFAANADYNASLNIKHLGDQSISLLLGNNCCLEASPRLSVVGS